MNRWIPVLFLLSCLSFEIQAQFVTQGPLPDGLGASSIRSFVVVSADTAYAAAIPQISGVYRNRVYRTTNGGVSWSVVFDTSYTGEIRLAKSRHALIATYNVRTIRSTNGGTTWSANLQTLSATPSAQGHISAAATDSSVVYISANTGTLFRSTNDGLTWTQLTQPTNPVFIYPYSAPRIYYHSQFVGGTLSPRLYVSSDSGKTWSYVASYNYNSSGNFHFFNNDTGFVAGSLGLNRTTNGGTSWTNVTVPSAAGTFPGIRMTGAGYGILHNRGTTTDSGATWQLLSGTPLVSGFYSNTEGLALVGSNTVRITFPTVPAMSQPADSAQFTDGKIPFVWSVVPGATSYRLQADTSLSFADPVAFKTIANGAATTDTLNPSIFLKPLYVRMRASNDIVGRWSPVRMVQLAIPPPALVSPRPDSGTPATSILLGWSAMGQSSISFQVQVASDGGFAGILKDTILVETAYSFAGLTVGSTYHWRVRAVVDGQNGPWSEVRTFRSVPANVTITSPLAGTTVSTPIVEFIWTTLAGATTYDLHVVTGAPETTLFRDTTLTVNDTTLMLAYAKSYTARIRAKVAGLWGAFSPITFSVGPIPNPVLISPQPYAVLSDNDVTFRWNKIPGVTGYDLMLETVDNNIVVLTRIDSLLSDTTRTLSFEYGKKYTWNVRGRSGSTIGGTGFNSPFSIDTLRAPVLVSPADGAIVYQRNVPLHWKRVAAATAYHLEFWGYMHESPSVNDSTIIDTTFTVQAIQFLDVYQWRVRAKVDGFWSVWSPTRWFDSRQNVELFKDSVAATIPSNVHVVMHALDPNGRGVDWLTQQHMIVQENGTPISPTESRLDIKRIDQMPYALSTILMLDNSASISAPHMAQIKEAAKSLIRAKAPFQRFAIYQFSESPLLRQELTHDTTALIAAIDGIPSGGAMSTNLYGSIITGLGRWTERFSLDGIEAGHLVVLTDGVDTQSSSTLQQVLTARGTKRISAIGFGPGTVPSTLEAFANAGVFLAPTVDSLKAAFARVQEEVVSFSRGFYWLHYLSPKRGPSIHTLSIALRLNANLEPTNTIVVNFSSAQFFSESPTITVNSSLSIPGGQDTVVVPSGAPQNIQLLVPFTFATPNYGFIVSPPGTATFASVPAVRGLFQVSVTGAEGTVITVAVVESVSTLSKTFRLKVGPAGSGGGPGGLPPLGTSWQLLGGPEGGEVSSIIATPNAVLAMTDRGIFRSTSNGQSWALLPSNGLSYPGMLYFVNGAVFYGSITGNDLRRSTDEGSTWTIWNAGITSLGINGLIASGDTMYAATGNGVFRSTNGGVAWSDFSSGLSVGAGKVVWSITKTGSTIIAGTAVGVRRLTQGSSTWQAATAGPSDQILSLISSAETTILGTNSKAHRSTDEGNTWTAGTGLPGSIVRSLSASGGVFFAGLEGSGIYRSENGGTSWIASHSGLSDRFIYGIAHKGGSIFVATDGRVTGGVYRSDDAGASWSPVNTGLRGIPLKSLAVGSSAMVVGTAGYGVFRSTDGGAQWTWANDGIPEGFSRSVNDVEVSNGIWHVVSSSPGIYRSTDDGATWNKYDTASSADAHAVSASGATVVTANIGGGPRISTDAGLTWATTPSTGLFTGDITAVTIAGGTVYIGMAQNGMARWTPGQTSWTPLGTASGPSVVYEIAVRGDTIYAGSSGSSGPFLSQGGFFASTDGGSTWSDRGEGIGHKTVGALVDVDGAVIVSNGNGTFRTNNAGDLWADVTEGLPLKSAGALKASGGIVYGVFGSDVWRRSQQQLTSVGGRGHERPEGYVLAQNYPNPFNPSTTIRFELPEEMHATIVLYDQLGREVARLAEGNYSAGVHGVKWSASGMSSGLYLCRLTLVGSDGRRSSYARKMVLLK